MNDSDAPSAASTLDEAPVLRPFYPKALVCFIITALCLGWLISLQVHSQAQPGAQPPAPHANMQPSSTLAPRVLNPRPVNASRQLSDADFALAEIDVLQALVDQEDPSIDFKKIANALRPYTYSLNAAVRETATRELARVLVTHDKVALKSITDATAQAQVLADTRDFGGALTLLKATLKGLPEDASWSGSGPDKKLNDMIADFERKRVAERESTLGGLEEALRKKDPGSRERLERVLAHADASIRTEAQAIEGRMADELDKESVAKRSLERTAREEWVRFFKRFGATLADGDFTGASEMIEQPPFEAILKGGVADPDKVLRRCAMDITAISNLYDEALKDGKGLRKQVSFHLRKGGQAAGTLVGTNGRMLRIMPSKGAEIGIKINELPAEGIRAILDSGIKIKPEIALALATLDAYETPADAQKIITTAYEHAREPLPLHWAERFSLEKSVQKTQEAEEKLAALKKALSSENADDVKAALTEARSEQGRV